MSSENIRVLACEIIPTVLKCIIDSDKPDRVKIQKNITKILVRVLINSCALEISLRPIKMKLECIITIIKLAKADCLGGSDISKLYNGLLHLIKNIKVHFFCRRSKFNPKIGQDQA